jgi:hypothetical protein
MVEIELALVSGSPRKVWVLTLDRRGVVLHDPRGGEAAVFAADQAERRIRLPSFWESVKHLGVEDDHGEVLWFRPDPEAVREVRDYLDRVRASLAPEELAARRTRGWVYVAAGLALAALGVALVLAFRNPAVGAARQPAGSWGGRKLLFLPFAFGVIGVYRGLKILRQCARARRVSGDEG